MQSQLDWLIIANGEPLPQERLLALTENKAVMALDGALASVLAAGIQPQIVLGDFDSLQPAAREFGTEAFSWVHAPGQEATDLEKGLHYLEDLRTASVTIANASGRRLDHALYNLRLLKKFHRSFKSLVLMTALEQVFYLENQKARLAATSPKSLAMLAFTQAEVSSIGLEYELQSLPLEFACQESISNQLLAKEGEVKVKGGLLLLCHPDIQVALE